jgi:tetratricopeptide (TPR) repeat protein
LLEPINQQQPANRQATLLRLDLESQRNILARAEHDQSPAAMVEQARRMVALAEPLFRKEPEDAEILRAMARTLSALARAHHYAGELPQALEAYSRVEALSRARLQKTANDPEATFILAYALNSQGDLLGSAFSGVNLGRDQEALGKYSEARSLMEPLQAARPNQQNYRQMYLVSLNNLAALYEVLGRIDDSIATAMLLVREHEAVWKRDPANAEHMRNYGVALNNLGDVQTTARRFADAEGSLTEALRIRERFAAKYPNTTVGKVDVASTLHYLGRLQNETGRARDAAASLRRSVALREDVLRSSKNASDLLWKQFQTLEALGLALEKLRSGDCREVYARAEAIAADLEASGKLAPAERGAAERIRKQMAACPVF